MTVHASKTDTLAIAGKLDVTGEGKIGWGPFSVGVQVTASMSVSKESKRASDYRSHTNAHVQMAQGAPPEGVSLILNSLNATTAKALELNQALIQFEMQAMAADAAANPGPQPEPQPKPKPPGPGPELLESNLPEVEDNWH